MSDLYPYTPIPLIYSPDDVLSVPPDRSLFAWKVKDVNGIVVTVQGIYEEFEEDYINGKVVKPINTNSQAQTFKDVFGIDRN